MQQPDSSTHVILRGPVVKALVPATAAVRPPSCTATAAEEADDEETPEDATHEKAPEDATHEEAASYLSVQSLEAEFLPILFRFKLEPVLGPAVQPTLSRLQQNHLFATAAEAAGSYSSSEASRRALPATALRCSPAPLWPEETAAAFAAAERMLQPQLGRSSSIQQPTHTSPSPMECFPSRSKRGGYTLRSSAITIKSSASMSALPHPEAARKLLFGVLVAAWFLPQQPACELYGLSRPSQRMMSQTIGFHPLEAPMESPKYPPAPAGSERAPCGSLACSGAAVPTAVLLLENGGKKKEGVTQIDKAAERAGRGGRNVEGSMLPLCASNAAAAWAALLENGARADGRKQTERRQTHIKFLETNGSTEVSIGRTRVCCQLTAAPVRVLQQQQSVAAADGCVSVRVAFSPSIEATTAAAAAAPAAAADAACKKQQQHAKQQERQIELIVKRLLREGGVVSGEALAIAAGKWTWQLTACLTVLAEDGTTTDACIIALLASLLSFKLCRIDSRTLDVLQQQQGPRKYQQQLQHLELLPLCLLHKPLALTFAYATESVGADSGEADAAEGFGGEEHDLQQQQPQQQQPQQQQFRFVADPTALEEAILPGKAAEESMPQVFSCLYKALQAHQQHQQQNKRLNARSRYADAPIELHAPEAHALPLPAAAAAAAAAADLGGFPIVAGVDLVSLLPSPPPLQQLRTEELTPTKATTHATSVASNSAAAGKEDAAGSKANASGLVEGNCPPAAGAAAVENDSAHEHQQHQQQQQQQQQQHEHQKHQQQQQQQHEHQQQQRKQQQQLDDDDCDFASAVTARMKKGKRARV
ncbi:box A-binding factor [Cyclospora cayetanensis]|uniref:Box A-binding factor n=1 Tax=Cyclospora cayetanensis TaxID=88456 RepID=A0A6P6S024_9EIME|nr:box A-binding factor [Cyclospora cayetanensis]